MRAAARLVRAKRSRFADLPAAKMKTPGKRPGRKSSTMAISHVLPDGSTDNFVGAIKIDSLFRITRIPCSETLPCGAAERGSARQMRITLAERPIDGADAFRNSL